MSEQNVQAERDLQSRVIKKLRLNGQTDLKRPTVVARGEYVRDGSKWYQIKRVVHHTDNGASSADLFAITIVDPTRNPLTMSEWLEPAP